jgi:hypothetical protein
MNDKEDRFIAKKIFFICPRDWTISINTLHRKGGDQMIPHHFAMAQPKNSAVKVTATATAFRGRTSGFLFKIVLGENYGWLNYNSVAEDIADKLQKGIEDALGVRADDSVSLTVILSKNPDTELRSGKKFLALSDVKVVDYDIV